MRRTFSVQPGEDGFDVVDDDSGDIEGTYDSKSEAEDKAEELNDEEESLEVDRANFERLTTDVVRYDMPILRMDADKREVWGWASSSVKGLDGKRITHDCNKEAFGEWINRTTPDGLGKIGGNMREMHAGIAAGRAIAWEPDDTNQRIYLGTRVSRGAESTWQKIEDGTLAAFSVNAKVLKHHVEFGPEGPVDVVERMRIREVSYVDSGGDPTSHFVDIIRSACDSGDPLCLAERDVEDLDLEIQRRGHGAAPNIHHSHGHTHPTSDGIEVEHDHPHDHPANHTSGAHSHPGNHEASSDHTLLRSADPEPEVIRYDYPWLYLTELTTPTDILRRQRSQAELDNIPPEDFAWHDRADHSYPVQTDEDVEAAAQATGRLKGGNATDTERARLRQNIRSIAERKGLKVPDSLADDTVTRARAPEGDTTMTDTLTQEPEAPNTEEVVRDMGEDPEKHEALDVATAQLALSVVNKLLVREMEETTDPNDANDGSHIQHLLDARACLVQFCNEEESEAGVSDGSLTRRAKAAVAGIAEAHMAAAAHHADAADAHTAAAEAHSKAADAMHDAADAKSQEAEDAASAAEAQEPPAEEAKETPAEEAKEPPAEKTEPKSDDEKDDGGKDAPTVDEDKVHEDEDGLKRFADGEDVPAEVLLKSAAEAIFRLETRVNELEENQANITRAADARVEETITRLDALEEDIRTTEAPKNRPMTRVVPLEKSFGLEEGGAGEVTRDGARGGFEALRKNARTPQEADQVNAMEAMWEVKNVYADGARPAFGQRPRR